MLKIDEYTVLSHAEDPSLMDKSYQDFRASWPEFMLHSPLTLKSKEMLVELAPDFQFFLQSSSGDVVAICRSIPTYWDGMAHSLPSGYDEARVAALLRCRDNAEPNTLLGLSITIPPRFRTKGLSSVAIRAMKEICKTHGLENLIVPVRPSLKASYPLMPIHDYAEWTTSDGSPFDPWLRAHTRLGAKILRCSAESMTIQGTIEEWESWTGLRFPQSAEYIIPGGGSPLAISRESNLGTYYDPNVWVAYCFSSR
jgi:hypothetical protein